jgi:hypothetical protein
VSKSRAAAPPQKAAARPVSQRGDRHEREADRAAEVVGRHGSVSGWSFSAVSPTAAKPVQRQEAPKEKTEDEKLEEGLKKAGEAALETEQGKALKEKVLEDPLVKTVKDAVTSTPGIIATGAVAAGGVAALAATGKELPFQPPEIPLDKITPGLSAQVTYEGPVNAPTFVGLSITYKEQGSKGKGKAKKVDPIAAETARLRAENERFQKGITYAPGSKEAEEQRLADEAVNTWVLYNSTLPGFTIPLVQPAPEKAKKKEETPAQPSPASASAELPAHAGVDAALSGPGRPLDRPLRRAMEARFGYDFSGVRVHDDARAAQVASGIDAAAFTVGQHLVFGPGRYSAAGADGPRLVAHELAHVVQQSDRGAPRGDVPSQGRPLDTRLREEFERRLAANLGGVTVHDDPEAAAAARERRAKAYTVGRHLVFGRGQYAPHTPRGKWLLAHELAHVTQGTDAGAVDGAPAVEADASRAATNALQGKPARTSARRSAGAVHRFGEPDTPPDLTFVSSSGTPGFLTQATAYHRTWGLNPTRFNSMQGLLATLAASTGTISRLRIVSHADMDNIFTPLFDGGAPGITLPELTAWGTGDVAGLRSVLGGPLGGGDFRNIILTSAEQANPAIFATFGITPPTFPTTGPIAELLDAAVDLLIVRNSEDMPAAQRTQFEAGLTAELSAARAAVVAPGASGATAATEAQAQSLQDAVTGVGGISGGLPAQTAGVMRNVRTATAAVNNGFRANLNAVRRRLTSSSFVDIRGCRVGQQPAYLTAVSTFFGGVHVSGPDLCFPRLGWHSIPEAGLAQKAAEGNVQTALDHWADVTGVRERLEWWLRFLRRVMLDDALQTLQETQALVRPPGLLGGLTLQIDPLIVDFTADLPRLQPLQEPTLGSGVGFQGQRQPTFAPGRRLQNPLVPVAQRDLARYSGTDGLFKYYMDVGLPLPTQEGPSVESLYLIFKLGRERAAIDAWTGSEWAPAAPGLTAVQSGSWSRNDIRQVEAVVNLDAQRNATEMYVSPDPRYAAHIQSV